MDSAFTLWNTDTNLGNARWAKLGYFFSTSVDESSEVDTIWVGIVPPSQAWTMSVSEVSSLERAFVNEKSPSPTSTSRVVIQHAA